MANSGGRYVIDESGKKVLVEGTDAKVQRAGDKKSAGKRKDSQEVKDGDAGE